MPEIEVSGLMVMTSVMIRHLLTGEERGLLGERKNQEMVPIGWFLGPNWIISQWGITCLEAERSLKRAGVLAQVAAIINNNRLLRSAKHLSAGNCSLYPHCIIIDFSLCWIGILYGHFFSKCDLPDVLQTFCFAISLFHHMGQPNILPVSLFQLYLKLPQCYVQSSWCRKCAMPQPSLIRATNTKLLLFVSM